LLGICEYEGLPRVLDEEMIDRVAGVYFTRETDMGPTRAGGGSVPVVDAAPTDDVSPGVAEEAFAPTAAPASFPAAESPPVAATPAIGAPAAPATVQVPVPASDQASYAAPAGQAAPVGQTAAYAADYPQPPQA
ncbi:MAG: hypothetical protein ACR2QE_02225, partial [Acidimicrobiales bacterium]